MRDDMKDRGPTEWESSGARPSIRLTPQMVFGALVMVFGLVLLADNLGWADADRVLQLWPLGLVAVGVLKLFGRGSSGRVFGGLLMVIGLGFSAERLFGIPIDFDDWWPVVLIGFGVLILTRGLGRGRSEAADGATRDAYFSEFATWAGKQRRVASSSFRGADLTAVMGGIEIDLRGAATAKGDAVVDVFVMWGGIEIWVPSDWAVINEVTVLMGGVDDRSSGGQGATNRLTIRGVVVMGGLDIKT